jgi:hypothetical protein
VIIAGGWRVLEDSTLITLPSMGSQGAEEQDQVGLLLVGEANGKAGFVEVHHLAQIGGEAVVE